MCRRLPAHNRVIHIACLQLARRLEEELQPHYFVGAWPVVGIWICGGGGVSDVCVLDDGLDGGSSHPHIHTHPTTHYFYKPISPPGLNLGAPKHVEDAGRPSPLLMSGSALALGSRHVSNPARWF